MLQLAIGGHPSFVLDERELRRGGVSYTVDTLRELQSETPDAELYLIMGPIRSMISSVGVNH